MLKVDKIKLTKATLASVATNDYHLFKFSVSIEEWLHDLSTLTWKPQEQKVKKLFRLVVEIEFYFIFWSFLEYTHQTFNLIHFLSSHSEVSK